MQNVNRGVHNDRRTRHSGPTEEGQGDIVGASGEDVQSLDLNHATLAQLEAIEELSGGLAQSIVEHRVHHGHFTSWDQVAALPGIATPQLSALQRAARLAEHPQPGDDRTHAGEPMQRGGGLP